MASAVLAPSTFLGAAVTARVQPKAQSSKAFVVKASADEKATRRSLLGLVALTAAASASKAFAAEKIAIGGPPPPIGGLPGTKSSDEARNTDISQYVRNAYQNLSVADTKKRLKNSAAEIADAKGAIDRKSWWEVQSTLRTEMGYVRVDVRKLAATLPAGQKKAIEAEANAVYKQIEALDLATRKRDQAAAAAKYQAASAALSALVAKLV
uniref:Oxygen evolving enhancer protein 3 n=1 Tax=Mesostigma viride TaxID=41882 RepID=A0A7S5CEB7_MESVI|eukprot:jgi/Mesvir1/26577/Mv16231-RA.1